MVRKKRDSGKDSFELTPENANKLHDNWESPEVDNPQQA